MYKEGVADQLQTKINEIEQTYQIQVESLKKQISDVKKEGQQQERQFQYPLKFAYTGTVMFREIFTVVLTPSLFVSFFSFPEGF